MKTIIKSFTRNFKKRKVIYSITIGGFAISMAVLVLIVAFIIDEKGYDKHFANIDKIYRIKHTDGNLSVPVRALNEVSEKVPEVEAMCLFKTGEVLFAYNNQKQKGEFLQATKEYFNIFSVKILKGNIPSDFKSNSEIVVTEKFANKLFGTDNPLGKVITVDDKSRSVVAVIENPKANSSINYEVVVPLDTDLFSSSWCNNYDCYYLYSSALLINTKTNIDSAQSKIARLLDVYPVYEGENISLQPYADIYFDCENVYDNHKHANVKMLKLLTWIALIIFVLAVLNFINLSTASNIERQKEVCIRKTSGAKNRIIIRQFLGETYVICLLALMLAMVLLVFIAPVFTNILGRNFEVLTSVLTKNSIVVLLGTFLLVGLLSGLYPALMVAKYNPIQLVGKSSGSSKVGARGVFNLFQFTVSIVLITCLIVINKQLNFVKTKDFGFETDHLLSVYLDGETNGKADIIKPKLFQNPNVLSATTSDGIPFEVWMVRSGNFHMKGKEYNVQQVYDLPVDENFLETFKIKLIDGRDFRPSDKNVCVINETFYKELELTDLNNANVWGSDVVGVIQDIHFEDMKKRIGKIFLKYEGAEKKLEMMSVRIANNNIPETMKYIKSVMHEIDPEIDLDYTFFNDKLDEMYKQEDKQASAIRVFSFIAILLSCLGLFGMVEFNSKKRKKEIGVRRVNGAKIADVLFMLNKDFTVWVIVAFIVACPISYILMNKWLESFAYRTELNWYLFLMAGVIVLLVAIITISWHSWQTSKQNPVEAIRYE